MPKYISGTNMPGYLPDNEPFEHDTWEEALEGLLAHIEVSIEACNQWMETAFSDQIEEELEKLEALKKEIPKLQESACPYNHQVANRVYWVTNYYRSIV